jgi:hypothetical protein
MTPENEEATRELNSEAASVRPAGDGRSLLLDLGAGGERGYAPAVPTATTNTTPAAGSGYGELARRLRAEEQRMQSLRDFIIAQRGKHQGAAFGDINQINHAVSGRDHVLTEAAATITRQAKRIAELEKALNGFVDHYPGGINPYLDMAYRNARAALRQTQEPST